MSELQQRKLVRLRDRYGGLSRMSLWRLRRSSGFPAPVVILKTEFYYTDELQMFEEGRRRRAQSARDAGTSNRNRREGKGGAADLPL
jgi:hypothetical protein